MIAIRALAAAISCVMVVVLLHYFLIAVMRPRRLLELTGAIDGQQRNWPYLIAAFLGGAVFLFNGFDALLSWIPLSWGGVDDDGTFHSVRHSISGILSFLSLPLLGYVEKSAMREVQIDWLQERVADLEKQLPQAPNAS